MYNMRVNFLSKGKAHIGLVWQLFTFEYYTFVSCNARRIQSQCFSHMLMMVIIIIVIILVTPPKAYQLKVDTVMDATKYYGVKKNLPWFLPEDRNTLKQPVRSQLNTGLIHMHICKCYELMVPGLWTRLSASSWRQSEFSRHESFNPKMDSIVYSNSRNLLEFFGSTTCFGWCERQPKCPIKDRVGRKGISKATMIWKGLIRASYRF